MIYLQQWMRWAGIGTRDLAARIGIAPQTISTTLARQSRPAWLIRAAQEIGIAPEMLMVSPADDAARGVRGKVLLREARRRLARPCSAAPHRSGSGQSHPHRRGPVSGT